MSEKTIKTIDITPSWRAAVRIYLAVLEDGNEEGKRAAREDLTDLGAKMDEFNAVKWGVVLDAAERRAEQWRYAVDNDSPEGCINEIWSAGHDERVEWAEGLEAAVESARKFFDYKS